MVPATTTTPLRHRVHGLDRGAARRFTTGISAADRATTILTAIAPTTRSPTDISRPGHVFPSRARPGGVLGRAGQTEASVDLAASPVQPAAVICEIMNEDGTMARLPDLGVLRRARPEDRLRSPT